MRSAKPTTNWLIRISGIFIAIFYGQVTIAQENSPYSRYGMGDAVPNQNVVNRGMGGISAAVPNFLSVNFNNPASLGNLSSTRGFSNTIFDIGGEIDIRTLKSTVSPEKFKSVNTLISYLQIAFPISSKKMEKKGTFWGVSLGLRPLTRINYKVEKTERLSGIDSLQTVFEGSGGLNQVNVSTGLRIKNLNIGISGGYTFGTKDYSTKLNFINDSLVYYKSNTEAKSQFGGFFLNTGIQYVINTKNGGALNLGGYVNMQQKLSATRDKINETFTFSQIGSVINIDTIDYRSEEAGKVDMPMTYGFGFAYQDKNRNWLIGVDYEATNWSSYQFYGEKDAVQDNWVIRAGAEYYPARANVPTKKYWSFVKYRAGIYYGPDYIKLNTNRPNYAATIGASFPLTNAQRIRFGDYVLLNTAFEIGGRGNKQSQSLKENILRFSMGISMNARWFEKRKYD